MLVPGLVPVVDIGLAHPLRQRHRVHPEIGGDLLDRHPVITVASDPHDVVAELLGYGLGTVTSFQPAHHGQANSDVTYSCSRPTDLMNMEFVHFRTTRNPLAPGSSRAGRYRTVASTGLSTPARTPGPVIDKFESQTEY